ncbi:BapA/Bap/LapF family prefix-like domain-containing protein [Acinetobacter sp. CFCC 10889]|uniref:BapA/Bap/LapF family prefix-like domain-containing protein n=1 Tax=Acinetobacter sp. CFCC 10889 TaxID=1775557 RepID=UPI000DCFBEA9|nr:BapA prefix-like domain-containing protein [Acinetobacter sp. CFCC 10889]
MQKITLIDKSSLEKINVESSIIKLDKATIIQPNVKKEDILEIIQEGDHLIIKLKNGETITIENYFVKAADGSTSDLVFDGTVCAFEQLVWQDGVASFKELTGLEELLPIITGTSTGGVGSLPWIVGGLVTGGIIAATDDDSKSENEPAVVLDAPKVEILDDQNDDGFLSSKEIGDKTQVGIVVSIPTGAKAGDTITVTDQSGKKYTHVLVADDLSSGKVIINVDRPTEGTELKVTATISNKDGESESSPEDSAIIKNYATNIDNRRS